MIKEKKYKRVLFIDAVSVPVFRCLSVVFGISPEGPERYTDLRITSRGREKADGGGGRHVTGG
jgi:hypothetical protein